MPAQIGFTELGPFSEPFTFDSVRRPVWLRIFGYTWNAGVEVLNNQNFSNSARLAVQWLVPLLLGAIFYSARSQADWVNNETAGRPPDAIVGGQIVSGTTAFLCRAYHANDVQPGWTVKGDPTCHFSYAGRELTSTNFDWWVPSWRSVTGRPHPMPKNPIPFRGENDAFRYPCRVGGTPGKFGFDLGGCLYPYGGAEQYQPMNGFELLVDPDGGNVENLPGMTPTAPMWSEQFVGPFLTQFAGPYEGHSDPIPADAIVGGTDVGGQPLYLCSADVTASINQPDDTPASNQPGKARADWQACDVSYGGREHYVSSFYVLVPDWLPMDMTEGDNNLTCSIYYEGVCHEIPHPIAVGKDTSGEVLYACQVRLYPGPGVYPGKIGASFTGGCSYAMNGVENYSQHFSILTDGVTEQ
jgi:hypothetical protein